MSVKYLSLLFGMCLAGGALAYAGTLDKVIVVVNGETITQSELDYALTPIIDRLEQESRGGGSRATLEKSRKEVLNHLIEEKLILSEAKKQGITAEPAEIDERFKKVKNRFDSEEKFNEVIIQEGISLNELKERYADQIKMEKLIAASVRARVTLTPAEILAYYEQHRGEFREPEEVRVKNILIKTSPPRLKDETARRLAQRILASLKAGGDFDALARKFSKGPNADKGGDLGYVKRGQMRANIDEVIFRLERGQLSGAIKTELGYHLFKVEDKIPERVKALEEVRGDIEHRLYIEKGKAQYDKWIEELKKNAYISFR